MTPLAATLLYMHVVWVTPALEPVYARHFRGAELGAELRALEQAEQLELAAELAGVPLALLVAVAQDESGLDDARVSSCGALGRMQLNPASRWGRAWLEACAGRNISRNNPLATSACESGNVLWGAYALRDAIAACGGDEWAAVGFYRSGRCVRGPRGAATLELAGWLRVHLEVQAASTFAMASRSSAWSDTPRFFASSSSSAHVSVGSRTDFTAVPSAVSPFFGRPRRAHSSPFFRPSAPRPKMRAPGSSSGISRSEALLGPRPRRLVAVFLAVEVLFMAGCLPGADDSELVFLDFDDHDEKAASLGREANHRETVLAGVALLGDDRALVVEHRGGFLEGDTVLPRVALGLRVVPGELHKEIVTLINERVKRGATELAEWVRWRLGG